jgi:AAA+ superfamily predicted ATPase
MQITDSIIEKGKASYAALYVQTSEEQRALLEIIEAAAKLERKLFVWSHGKGLFLEGQRVRTGEEPKPIDDTELPPGVLSAMGSASRVPSGSIVVLKLFHHFLDDVLVQTEIRSLLNLYRTSKRMLIILTPVLKIPPELDRDLTLLEVEFPGHDELNTALEGLTKEMPEELRPSPERRKELIACALGLTTMEAQDAFSLSYVRPKMQGRELWDPKIVMDEKCLALKKTGMLEYIPVEEGGLNMVGGLDELKRFVRVRRNAFSEEAREYGLPMPKGILLMGVPGTGKSLGAKAISAELKLPLLRLDMGKVHGSLVGQSEANIRMALGSAEANAPCVLWIDELEKGIAGSSSELDSGVGARVLGTVLTWMQERKKPVYVYATANKPNLPPELIRKGRFDEMFSVDLPRDEERVEILKIHLRKRRRLEQGIKNDEELKLLMDTSRGYTGAEIEACIEAAMFSAFDDGRRDLTYIDIIDAFHSTKPQAVTMAEDIKRIRDWCRKHTVSANIGAQVDLTSVVNGQMDRKLD